MADDETRPDGAIQTYRTSYRTTSSAEIRKLLFIFRRRPSCKMTSVNDTIARPECPLCDHGPRGSTIRRLILLSLGICRLAVASARFFLTATQKPRGGQVRAPPKRRIAAKPNLGCLLPFRTVQCLVAGNAFG